MEADALESVRTDSAEVIPEKYRLDRRENPWNQASYSQLILNYFVFRLLLQIILLKWIIIL